MDDNTGETAGLMSSLDMEMLLSSVNLRLTLGKTTIDLVEIVTTLVNNIFEIVSRTKWFCIYIGVNYNCYTYKIRN